MSERAILVQGFMALPHGWPEKVETHRDPLLVSDGQHFIGSRAFPGGLSFIVPAWEGSDLPAYAYDYQSLAVAAADHTHLGIFVAMPDAARHVESPEVPAPFDRFKVGGERLPERAEV